jgi:hypothetical protein
MWRVMWYDHGFYRECVGLLQWVLCHVETIYFDNHIIGLRKEIENKKYAVV